MINLRIKRKHLIQLLLEYLFLLERIFFKNRLNLLLDHFPSFGILANLGFKVENKSEKNSNKLLKLKIHKSWYLNQNLMRAQSKFLKKNITSHLLTLKEKWNINKLEGNMLKICDKHLNQGTNINLIHLSLKSLFKRKLKRLM